MSVMNMVATLHQIDQEQVDLVVSEMDGVLGDLDGIRLRGQDILVGTFLRPGTKTIIGPTGRKVELFMGGTGKAAVEDVYQGKIVRILKLGPQALNPKVFPSLIAEWGGEENIPKVGDWVFVNANDGLQVSYKGRGSVPAKMFNDMSKMPSDGGWPCRIVTFSDIIGMVTDPAVLV